MSIITTASEQWAKRPSDERFTSLTELHDFTQRQHDNSRGMVLSSRNLQAHPVDAADDPKRKSLLVVGPGGDATVPTHWSFGQLANRVGAPAGYLRSLSSDLAADCINEGLYKRPVDEIGVLVRQNGVAELAAVTGPNYGRIWNKDVTRELVDHFGDGVTGDFRVPGEFGKEVPITKANTTLYASDRDLFAFLADEKHRIDVKGRRDLMAGGSTGSLARGLMFWNSEVGSATLGMAWFLFDYVCSNRIIWGAQNYQEVTLRHTSGAPDRFIEEVTPAIQAYVEQSSDTITDAIEAAQARRIEGEELDGFLAKRFTKSQATGIKLAHLNEEGRPIENFWDAAVGASAFAKSIQHQNDRVDIERAAGKLMADASR